MVSTIFSNSPVDFRRRPPYLPGPERIPLWKRRMSIVVGLCADDGIVLAADSRYTTNSGVVSYGRKIYPLQQSKFHRVVVAGAGDVPFINAASQGIQEALPAGKTTLIALQTIIEATNKDRFEQYVLPHGDTSRTPGYELLVGVYEPKDGLLLLETGYNATSVVQGRTMKGSGGNTASPYADLWWKGMSLFEAEIAAIAQVTYAKTYDAYCGGDTKVVTIFADGTLRQLGKEYIESAESYFKYFTKECLGLLLPADIDAELDEEFFTGGVGSLHDDLRHHRAELRRWHPQAYEPVS